MDEVNEQTDNPLTLSFTDDSGQPVTPITAKYKIIDFFSGTVIKPWTNITPDSDSFDLYLTKEDNRILNEENPYEVRIVTSVYEYGPDRQETFEISYMVENLVGIETERSK